MTKVSVVSLKHCKHVWYKYFFVYYNVLQRRHLLQLCLRGRTGCVSLRSNYNMMMISVKWYVSIKRNDQKGTLNQIITPCADIYFVPNQICQLLINHNNHVQIQRDDRSNHQLIHPLELCATPSSWSLKHITHCTTTESFIISSIVEITRVK